MRVGAEAPVSASPGFAQAQPWDARTYDETLNDPKKTVVDYFLLCPDIGLDSNGDFNVNNNIAPRRGAFEDRKNLLHKEFSTAGLSLKTVVVDIANAYINISGEEGSLAFDLTFVYFDRQGKSGVPAYSFFSEGVEADSRECCFFEVDGANAWTEITGKILPALSLSDLEMGPKENHGPYPEVGWDYTLPQKGTTVIASPLSTDHRDDSETPHPVDKHIEELFHRTIELLWDNKQGVFTRGAVLLPTLSSGASAGK